MDYGAEPSYGYDEVERKRVEDGVSRETSAGSEKSMDLEGQEVFKEAVEAQGDSYDQGVKYCPEDNIVSGDVHTDTVSELASSLVHESPDATQEVDSFDEASGIAGESGKHMEGEAEVIDNQRVDKDGEGLDRVHFDGIDSGGTGDGVLRNESYRMRDDELEGNDGSGGNEVSELNTDVVDRENISLADNNSILMSERTEIEDSEYVTPRINGGMVLENGSAEKVDNDVPESHPESEPEKEILNEDAGSKVEDLDVGDLDPESGDGKTMEKLNASGEPRFEIEDDIGEEVNGNSGHRNGENQVEISESLKHEAHGTDICLDNNNSDGMHFSGGNSTESTDYCNGDKNDIKSKSESEHNEAKFELDSASPDLIESVGERAVTPGAGSSSFLENSSSDNIVSVQANSSDLIEAGNEDFLSQKDDKVIHEAHDKPSVVVEPEKIQDKIVKEKLTTQTNREQNIQPALELSSSSGKSAVTGPPPVRPAGLGRAAPLEPAPRVVQQLPHVNGSVPGTQSQQIEDAEAEEYDETREKLQMIRVKFLRLAHRLGQTPHNVVVAQVLYRLGLAEQLRGRNGGRVGGFSFDRASAMAEQLEAAGQEPLDFSCTIMVLGKTGVGKSATINSIFDEVKFDTDAFHTGTKKVQDIVGTVQGIKRYNEKILQSVKRFIKKTPPDIVLYLDRLDMQSRDFSDMPLLRTITEIFGPSIWFNAIVVLTHAASAPPDGPNGTASSYDMFVTQRSHVVQQAIRQAAGDMRLMNPVSLVENHSACRTNRAGQRVLPNGQVWKPHLLLLSFASKILAEANALLKLQDSPPGKPFTARARAPPLPFLLSSLLQSRPQLKLPEEQLELNELPPFKPLTKAQVEKLSKAQKKAYFDELEYRERLFMKKQLKEEKKQRKMLKKMAESAKDLPREYSENAEEESGSAASVPVPMPDLALPASFDSDNPTHRYRYLDSSNQWLVRPVLETHGWDHDVGYEGINVERLFVVKDKIPLSFSGQASKDKKDANVQMEIGSSIKHGEGKATTLGFDMQTVGKDLAYTLRSETRFCNFRRNKATAGLSFTLLGDSLSGGVKVENKLVANKRFKLVLTGGAMTGRGDVAYGGSLEAQLKDKDYPLGRSLSTLGLSVMDWHGDLAVGCNVQSQIPVGRHTNLVARANLNNRGAGQISIRLNTSEQLQIVLIGLVPLLKKLVGYSEQLQFGQ
ncbi:translocase of chloroplast 120, chloroplastic-like [Senna tora]|uniref:Translocase of chloroplast 120, chloroplastic-like n=1 Tax=Senna tora TaxID=362788 RepID=A0A835CIF8_9FABA|nr:translocase of chloroplast 120, chloroplastic-like [Senna tora]